MKEHSKAYYLAWLGLVMVLGFSLRLYHITDPYMVDFHDWRQADTAAFTHNYLHFGLNPIYPRIDRFPCERRGQEFGLVEAELPVAAWLAALPLAALDIDWPPPWYLRLVTALLFLASCLYLFLLIKDLSRQPSLGVLTVLAYSLFPFAIFFTRTSQPDGPALFFTVATLYHLNRWLDDGRLVRHFVASALVGSLLFLIKVPNLFILMPVLFLFVAKKGLWENVKRPYFLLWLCLALPAVLAYYVYAHDYPWTFGIWPDREQSKFASLGEVTDFNAWYLFTDRAIWDIFTWPGIILMTLGFSHLRRNFALKTAAVWLLSVVIFLIVTIKGNRIHVYYQLPFVLPASIAAGAGMLWLWRRGLGGVVALLALGVVYYLMATHAIEKRGWPLHEKGYYSPFEYKIDGIELLRAHVPKGQYFVSTDHDPALYYNADRRGWFIYGSDINSYLKCMGDDISYVLIAENMEKTIMGNKMQKRRLEEVFEVAGKGRFFTLYKLKPKEQPQPDHVLPPRLMLSPQVDAPLPAPLLKVGPKPATP